ncbi:hypothetical protein EVAR_68039_1 [Eumeta japonica]|uniref:Uncharacterized protein n=1 Tax=Eumeta variegata TaxID=151549 RepID=A0A4C1SGI3_EUMVA|nr:hypothetical protein EVAR_68039_1 [Eumeta japonica]
MRRLHSGVDSVGSRIRMQVTNFLVDPLLPRRTSAQVFIRTVVPRVWPARQWTCTESGCAIELRWERPSPGVPTVRPLSVHAYRRDKAIRRRDRTRQPVTTPQLVTPLESVKQNLAAIRRRQQLRRRTAIFYSKISRLQERLNREIRNKEKYRKRCQRLIKNNQTSPEAKVSALLKNIKVPEVVRKKLILSEVLTKQLKDRYINLKKHVEKKKYFEIIKPDLLKKHKLLHLSKPFFRHGTYKRPAGK